VTLIADRPLLTSPRLLLRAPRKEDAGAIAALANDWEVARRLTRLPHPYTLDDAVFFLEEIVPKELVWIIESSAELVGVAGLTVDADGTSVELGYWLGRAFWGHGYATEAAGLVIDYAFDRAGARACPAKVGTGFAKKDMLKQKVSVVTAGCFTDNVRSLRVLRKLGFTIKGESLRFCMAQQRELPHYDLALARVGWVELLGETQHRPE
jgi:RimJ/RimL family protein N-acetyltransferase